MFLSCLLHLFAAHSRRPISLRIIEKTWSETIALNSSPDSFLLSSDVGKLRNVPSSFQFSSPLTRLSLLFTLGGCLRSHSPHSYWAFFLLSNVAAMLAGSMEGDSSGDV